MPIINYHHASGDTDVITAEAGTTLMRAAVSNGVDGIVGECGGQAMCATCHVYVRPGVEDALPAIGDDEDEMLGCTTAERTDRSRLGCQIKVGSGLDSIDVDVPAGQV